jgi:indole-3-glycerol phosphate synthase
MDILERIVQVKRAEVEREKESLPMRRAIELASASPAAHDFASALREKGRVNIIAEIKRASPSRGPIQPAANPAQIARSYAAAGAAAISVLTDERFFLGAPAHLSAARESVPVPILRKDFLFDEYQIYRSRALGADAVLLIARILRPKELATLLGVARSLQMEGLVEVHSEEEIAKALDCGASIVGVNNRDLATMTVSLEHSLRLLPGLPADVLKISESGIEERSDIDRLRAAGCDGFLIGERLMRDPDPGAALRRLIEGGPG